MKLTFLITDLHRGGSPLLLADLAPALQARGWNTHVLSIAPLGTVATTLQSAGIPTASLNARHNHDPAILPRLLRHLQSQKPDILCSILLHANLLATLAKPFLHALGHWPSAIGSWPSAIGHWPLIIGHSGISPSLPLSPCHPVTLSPCHVPPPLFIQSLHTLQENPAWHWPLQRRLAPHAHAFLAPSHAIIQKLQSRGGTEIPNPTVIPNAINVPRFFHAKPIENPPWPKDAIVVGSIARFDPVKRLHLLIQTLPLLPQNFHLALLGYGTEEPRLRHLASQLPTPNFPLPPFPFPLSSRIHFLGPTDQPERWYKSFNIYCSLSASEGYGLSLAEAVCAGIPVVTCDTPALRETLDHATWLPADPAPPTPSDIASAILAASRTAVCKTGHQMTQNMFSKGAGGASKDTAGTKQAPAGTEQTTPFPPTLEYLESRYGLNTMVDRYDAFFRDLLAINKRN